MNHLILLFYPSLTSLPNEHRVIQCLANERRVLFLQCVALTKRTNLEFAAK